MSRNKQFIDFSLQKRLVDQLENDGITEPTAIQRSMFPSILEGRNTVAVARTGTGKTLGYLLPIFHKWLENKKKHFVIICPTIELSFQVEKVARSWSKAIGIPVRRKTNKNPEEFGAGGLWIAYPQEWVEWRKCAELPTPELIVFDEIDMMLQPSSKQDFDQCFHSFSKKAQKIFCSATMPKWTKEFLEKHVHDIRWNEIIKHESNQIPLEEYVAYCDESNIEDLLFHILFEYADRKVLIFHRDMVEAREVYHWLSKSDLDILFIHGKKKPNTRKNFLEQFDKKSKGVMIATDVLSRGIDIDNIALVINLNIPETAAKYEHRKGRTARSGQFGECITLCTPNQKKAFDSLKKYVHEEIKIYKHPFDIRID